MDEFTIKRSGYISPVSKRKIVKLLQLRNCRLWTSTTHWNYLCILSQSFIEVKLIGTLEK